MNKTINNLKMIWLQLDKASGDLNNALDNLSSMVGLSKDTEKIMERIDTSLVDSLRNEIEALIMDKGSNVEDIAVRKKTITKQPSGNEYITGYYRLWKSPSGGIGIKFDGERELYNIPKSTDLHKRIEKRFTLYDE